jgi:mRNA-degrading endonuclease RelE of RelBE toxin-antitoxin system
MQAEENPHELPTVSALSGEKCDGQYRIRQGNYRIRFILISEEIVRPKYTLKGTIHIMAVKHRKEVYDECK